ncbi:hypothetical protein EYF80_002378 [Liparis tanakae]|uniref:Uncharacterized protein n=1 Tax=Liparis tanakae TaxID=230148 RepID=A0A4Z2JAI5_9TELE|nr:hypothetical protein EYF80_002378 [Liparis tanakae]
MILYHAGSHKCPTLDRAISDHQLESICLLLLLSQRTAITREFCVSGLISLTVMPFSTSSSSSADYLFVLQG